MKTTINTDLLLKSHAERCIIRPYSDPQTPFPRVILVQSCDGFSDFNLVIRYLLHLSSLPASFAIMAAKIIVVTGINGNQGGSVASTFLNTPGWTIRGITRSTDSASSKEWSAKGVEMVEADLDNTAELVKAFRGAHAIFCVTNFWQELGVPSNWAKAAQTGQDIRKICYDIELQRGKNMIDVASTADKDGILEHLVLSVVPSSLEQSGGKIKGNYHFDAKWAWVCINSCVEWLIQLS